MLTIESELVLYKAYKREVWVLSHDNNNFLIVIEIQNIVLKQDHQNCRIAILDIDMPYQKDLDNISRNIAYQWSEYLVNKV